MIRISTNSRTLAANSLFSIFFLSVFGWALLQSWALRFKATLLIHAVIACTGLVLSGVAAYRYRLHWPASELRGQSSKGDVVLWGALLLATGLVTALLVARGPLLFLAIAGASLTLIPWTKVSLCRDHFFLSSGLLGAGAAIGLASCGWQIDTLRYPFAAWMFWLISCVMLMLVVAALGDRRERMSPAGT